MALHKKMQQEFTTNIIPRLEMNFNNQQGHYVLIMKINLFVILKHIWGNM